MPVTLPSSALSRLGVSVLAVSGLLPISLNARNDTRPLRKLCTCLGGASLALWAIGWTLAPIFTDTVVVASISAARNIGLGLALSIAAYVDALVLSATVTASAKLKSVALYTPVAVEAFLAVFRGAVSVRRDSIADVTDVLYVQLNNISYALIACELTLAAVVSLTACIRLQSIISSGSQVTSLVRSRWNFTVEVFVYAAGAFAVLILCLLGVFEIGQFGVVINAAEVQYVLRTLIAWGNGAVDKRDGSSGSGRSEHVVGQAVESGKL
ncbi:hypothetical protein DFJ73DRAFT_964597 [Zopfochytrium polystomum]|nr:hypothetical protein DFJ73DRAFT_964597 [Zopfochytrium polystomum]